MKGTSTKKKALFGIVLLAFGVVGWISFKRVRPLMMLGYVDSAIGRVRTVVSAESEFAKNNPGVGYACTLSQLPDDGGILRRVKTGEDNGYAFEISGCEEPRSGTPSLKYWITARPLHAGLPAFCSDQSAVLRIDQAGSVEKCEVEGSPLG